MGAHVFVLCACVVEERGGVGGGGGCASCQKSYYKTTNRNRDLVLHTEVTKEVTLTWRGERAVWFERVSDRIANYFCFKSRERGDTRVEGGGGGGDFFCLFVVFFVCFCFPFFPTNTKPRLWVDSPKQRKGVN